MTIEEKLAEYKDKNLSFYEGYIDCTPIEEIEGDILEDAKWCGYAVTDKYGHRYFTDYGIRGCVRGSFKIKNGQPIEMLQYPGDDIMNYIGKLITSKDIEKHLNFGSEISAYRVYRYLKENWYDKQQDT